MGCAADSDHGTGRTGRGSYRDPGRAALRGAACRPVQRRPAAGMGSARPDRGALAPSARGRARPGVTRRAGSRPSADAARRPRRRGAGSADRRRRRSAAGSVDGGLPPPDRHESFALLYNAHQPDWAEFWGAGGGGLRTADDPTPAGDGGARRPHRQPRRAHHPPARHPRGGRPGGPGSGGLLPPGTVAGAAGPGRGGARHRRGPRRPGPADGLCHPAGEPAPAGPSHDRDRREDRRREASARTRHRRPPIRRRVPARPRRAFRSRDPARRRVRPDQPARGAPGHGRGDREGAAGVCHQPQRRGDGPPTRPGCRLGRRRDPLRPVGVRRPVRRRARRRGGGTTHLRQGRTGPPHRGEHRDRFPAGAGRPTVAPRGEPDERCGPRRERDGRRDAGCDTGEPVRSHGLLRVRRLPLRAQSRRLPRRPARLPRPAPPGGVRRADPARGAPRAPSRPPTPRAELRQHQHRDAVRRPGQRDPRVCGGPPVAAGLRGPRRAGRGHRGRADGQPPVRRRDRLRPAPHAGLPQPLPYHRGLESARAYLRRAQVSLSDAMATLRTTDAVDPGSRRGSRRLRLARHHLGTPRALPRGTSCAQRPQHQRAGAVRRRPVGGHRGRTRRRDHQHLPRR